ncbi:hypothetical protein [Actinokineospora bangkokensis]|uniref:HAF repeat-containing protein n=1 Tax=Actinokineospora bangkokensis TaxID=1193682 RepID=A0A1Q9LMA2_9PSEU|nr:hypothetical protein [Actinokineospora bangkokensis]OLR93167.1 hypothetical protein BJP25_16845 [Actinokineospora bangkokensis]
MRSSALAPALVFAAVVAAVLPGTAVAAPVLRPLPTPAPAYTSWAQGVTPSGLVVGTIRPAGSLDQQAVTWRGGVLRPLDTHPSQAIEFNDRDQVVGTRTVDGVRTGVLWSGGAAVDLLPPGTTTSVALGIANTGEVLVRGTTPAFTNVVATWRAGTWRTLSEDAFTAAIGPLGDVAVWTGQGTRVFPRGQSRGIEVPNPFGGTFPPNPLEVNARGDVLFDLWPDSGGTRVGLWRRGALTELGTLGGDQTIAAVPGFGRGRYLNDAGEVTGSSETASGAYHAFRWRDGRMTDLTPTSATSTRGFSINQLGDVAGTSAIPGTGRYEGRVWTRTGRTTALAPTAADRKIDWLALSPFGTSVVGAESDGAFNRHAISSAGW